MAQQDKITTIDLIRAVLARNRAALAVVISLAAVVLGASLVLLVADRSSVTNLYCGYGRFRRQESLTKFNVLHLEAESEYWYARGSVCQRNLHTPCRFPSSRQCADCPQFAPADPSFS